MNKQILETELFAALIINVAHLLKKLCRKSLEPISVQDIQPALNYGEARCRK
jgi:hypothetical protein